ncbi:MAG: hypothetical protein EOP86_12270 [Verrucomicrobiaceae bacterium]|nr:MAG: hypothetical protein EOP86_12270 [Verrucomicrobiaceae bacterium]
MSSTATEAPPSPLEMPFVLVFTTFILLPSSARSLVENVEKLILREGRLDPACLICIPLCWGLLRGSRSARIWLGVVAGLWVAFLLGFRRSGQTANDVGFWGFALLVSHAVWVLSSLRTERVRQWFSGASVKRSPTIGWGLLLFFATLLGATHSAFARQRHRVEMQSTFHIDTTVSVEDAVTGAALEEVSWSASGGTELQRVSASLKANGSRIRFSGRSDKPVTVVIRKNGFEPGTIVLERQSPELMTLKLQPLPAP